LSGAVTRVLSSLSESRPEELLEAWRPRVLKGNAGEIGALAGSLEVVSSYCWSVSYKRDDDSLTGSCDYRRLGG